MRAFIQFLALVGTIGALALAVIQLQEARETARALDRQLGQVNGALRSLQDGLGDLRAGVAELRAEITRAEEVKNDLEQIAVDLAPRALFGDEFRVQ